ncbi:TetR/AcrR family transcriptional regulator [Salinibacter altiplanensis]|uniref:TetR/AcrR family transcriptional regulator n=1 Tax=Salinibacter altiplanensis TaxID=1803181 RepID=UPI000C9F747A|nr:TetR/AcrR family transcriptional regulator [Salinibacter altiplanensis]
MTKRDDISEAALALFAENGIEATTTREIAEHAGAAEGTLYRHFDGKADLAQWLYRRCLSQLRDTLTDADEETSAPTHRLEALVRGVFDFYASRPASCTYLLSARESGIVSGSGNDSPPSPIRLFARVLDEGAQQGVFRETSSLLVAGWILAMVQRTVLFLKTDTLSSSTQDAIDQTVDAARRLATARPS